jgi:hypothetical protein
MVNPPRDEIRRIRLQLQEHGPVGDANVFYWFQNRKSRTKHKLRAAGKLQQPSARAALARASLPAHSPVTPPRHHHLIPASTPVAPDTSSSSSDRSSGSSSKSVVKPEAVALASSPAIQPGFLPATAMDFLTPPPALAARQLYYHGQIVAPATVPTTPDLMITSPDSLLLQWQQQSPYMPATDLGAQYAPVSPNVLLGLCNEAAALGQDCMSINSSNSKGVVGHGQQYWNNGGAEVCAKTDDAVSAVIRDDEKARLGSLHYDFGVNTTTTAPPVHAAATDAACTAASAGLLPRAATQINVAAATATSALLTDQLQGMPSMHA